jgi:uncharacterized protein YndB with AHSA1/START domain
LVEKHRDVAAAADREIVVGRVLDVQRELVFEAWTNAESVAQWWGPNGFTNTIQEMDVRPGGVWRHVLHSPDGVDYSNKSIFTEVVSPQRLAYRHCGPEEGRGLLFDATVDFAEQGAGTEITMRMLFRSTADRDFLVNEFAGIDAANQTLERLAQYLANK